MQRAHLNLSAISSDLAGKVKQLCVIEPISNGRQIWEGVPELQHIHNPLSSIQSEKYKSPTAIVEIASAISCDAVSIEAEQSRAHIGMMSQ
jgi:hypothetical protein